MENIENIKKVYISFFSEKFYKKKTEELTDAELKNCSLLSEIWAYISNVIPEDYGQYSIFDFNGNVLSKNGEITSSSLPPKIALEAKDKICKFCWDMRWEDISEYKMNNEDSNTFLRKKSVMMNRFSSGGNVVIFGSSDKPSGRTMLASILMKEAIRLRVTHGVRGQTYDWIDFSKLFNSIEKDADDLIDYKSCDWLVVDNITKKIRSSRQTTLLVDMIDPFFINRYNNRQPTILVFKFDIRDEKFDIEKNFGVGVKKIINSKRTLKIPLSEYVLSDIDD